MTTKTKKVVTPLKDENVSVKFASPLDMEYKKPTGKATEMRKEMTLGEMEKLQTKYRDELLGTPVLDDRQAPGPTKVDDWREGFEKEYGWIAPNNVIGFYRAILQELYRMRVGK